MSKLSPHEMFKKKRNLYAAEVEKIASKNHLTYGKFGRDRVLQEYHESICQHHALITILAANRYQIDNSSLPGNLEKLIDEGYLKKIPTDPYTDKSLIYKVTEEGFILYSVGRDFKDNDGKYTLTESWKGTEKGGDYIFWPVFSKEIETLLKKKKKQLLH